MPPIPPKEAKTLFDEIERLRILRDAKSRGTLLALLSPESDLRGESEFRIVASVCLALLSHGPSGVRALTDPLIANSELPDDLSGPERVARSGTWLRESVRRADYIIRVLWCASRAREVRAEDNYRTWSTSQTLDDSTTEEARRAFDELLEESVSNDSLHSALSSAMDGTIRDDPGHEVEEQSALAALRYEIATRSLLPLTARMVRSLTELVKSEAAEERYQRFFAKNPVFLDPKLANLNAGCLNCCFLSKIWASRIRFRGSAIRLGAELALRFSNFRPTFGSRAPPDAPGTYFTTEACG